MCAMFNCCHTATRKLCNSIFLWTENGIEKVTEMGIDERDPVGGSVIDVETVLFNVVYIIITSMM